MSSRNGSPIRTRAYAARFRALLEEDLTEPELVYRLRALLPPTENTEAPPTTDEATDHPGYQ